MVNEGNPSNISATPKVSYTFDEALEIAGFGWFQLKLLILTG